jgi:hypothetical protein
VLVNAYYCLFLAIHAGLLLCLCLLARSMGRNDDIFQKLERARAVRCVSAVFTTYTGQSIMDGTEDKPTGHL